MVDDHGRGVDFVCGEASARVERVRGMNHAQVVRLSGGDGRRSCRESLDAARGRSGAEAAGERQGHCAAPSRAVVRSKPNAMLKHSTPWPDAPLIRLSSAAVTTAFFPWAATLMRHTFVWLASLVLGVWSTKRVNGWPQ